MTLIENFSYHPDPVVNGMAVKLLKEFRQQEDVLGLFLSGSTASGGRDRYSDVDISVVARNKAAFKISLPSIIKKITTLLFAFEPDFLLPNLCIFYLQAGYKFDFYVYSPGDSLAPSFSKQAVILLDTEGHLAAKQNSWKKQTIQNGLKEKYLTMALADLWALRREVYRRNLFEARYNLDDARWCIATYVNLSRDHHYYGYDNFDRHLKPSVIGEMKQSLQDNASFSGIIKAGLYLLRVIAAFGYFDGEVIEVTQNELRKVLINLNPSPTYLNNFVPEAT